MTRTIQDIITIKGDVRRKDNEDVKILLPLFLKHQNKMEENYRFFLGCRLVNKMSWKKFIKDEQYSDTARLKEMEMASLDNLRELVNETQYTTQYTVDELIEQKFHSKSEERRVTEMQKSAENIQTPVDTTRKLEQELSTSALDVLKRTNKDEFVKIKCKEIHDGINFINCQSCKRLIAFIPGQSLPQVCNRIKCLYEYFNK